MKFQVYRVGLKMGKRRRRSGKLSHEIGKGERKAWVCVYNERVWGEVSGIRKREPAQIKKKEQEQKDVVPIKNCGWEGEFVRS